MNTKVFLNLNFVKVFYITLIVAIIFIALKAFMPIISGIVVAFIIAYIFEPFVRSFEKRHIKREIGITIFFLITIFILYFIFYFVKLNLPKPEDINSAYINIKKWLYSVKDILNEKIMFINWDEIINNIDNNIKDSEQLSKSFGILLKGLAGATTYLLIIPLCTLFFMISWHDMRKWMISIIPNRYFEITYKIFRDIDTIFGGYIRGIIIETFLICGLTFLGLYIVGFPFILALVLGIVAGVTNVVPYIGPWFGAIVGIITLYMGIIPEGYVSFFDLKATFINTSIVFIIVQLLDNILVKPLVLGNAVNLHPIVIIIGVIAGGHLMGFLGVLISIPLIAIINVSLRTLYKELKGYKMFDSKLFEVNIIHNSLNK